MNKYSLSKVLVFELRYTLCTTLLLTFCLSIVQAKESMTWLDQGPYELIGSMNLPMPITVVNFTRDRLHDQPAGWEVENILLGKPRQQLAVAVRSAKGEIRFLVTSQFWCLLTEQSLPCINEVLGHNLSRQGLSNEKKLHDYLETLDYMLIGQGFNLDDEFIRRELTAAYSRREWLKGQITSVKVLRRICDRPKVAVQGNQVTITYKRVTYAGSVLRRTVHARQCKWLEITGLEEVEVQPMGTISYPYL